MYINIGESFVKVQHKNAKLFAGREKPVSFPEIFFIDSENDYMLVCFCLSEQSASYNKTTQAKFDS